MSRKEEKDSNGVPCSSSSSPHLLNLTDDVLRSILKQSYSGEGGSETLASLASSCRRLRHLVDDPETWWDVVSCPKLCADRVYNPPVPCALHQSSLPRVSSGSMGTFNPPASSSSMVGGSRHGSDGKFRGWKRSNKWANADNCSRGKARSFSTRCSALRGVWSSQNSRGTVMLLTFTDEGLTGFRLPHPVGPRMTGTSAAIAHPPAIFDVVPEGGGRLKVSLRHALSGGLTQRVNTVRSNRRRYHPGALSMLLPSEAYANPLLEGMENLHLEIDKDTPDKLRIVSPEPENNVNRRPKLHKTLLFTAVAAVVWCPRFVCAYAAGKAFAAAKEVAHAAFKDRKKKAFCAGALVAVARSGAAELARSTAAGFGYLGVQALKFFFSSYYAAPLTRPLRNFLRFSTLLPPYAELAKRFPVVLAISNNRILRWLTTVKGKHLRGAPLGSVCFIWLGILQLCDDLYSEAEILCPEGRWLCPLIEVAEKRKRMVWYGGDRTVSSLRCIMPIPDTTTSIAAAGEEEGGAGTNAPEPYSNERRFQNTASPRMGTTPGSLFGVRMWVLGQFDGVEAIHHIRLLMADVISSTGLMLSIEGDENTVRGTVAVGTSSTGVGHEYFQVKRVRIPETLREVVTFPASQDDLGEDTTSMSEAVLLAQACRTVQAYVRQPDEGMQSRPSDAENSVNMPVLEAMYNGEVHSRMSGRTPAVLLSFVEPDVVVLVSHRGAYGQAYILTVFDTISWDTYGGVIRGGKHAISYVPL